MVVVVGQHVLKFRFSFGEEEQPWGGDRKLGFAFDVAEVSKFESSTDCFIFFVGGGLENDMLLSPRGCSM